MTDVVDSFLTIEAGGMADLPDVMIAMRDAFDPEYGEAWTEPQCAGILGMPGSWLTVARDGREPAGFAMARSIAGEAELLLIAVRPAFRRQGIGRALLERIVDDARALGAQAVHLEVRAGNSARDLYMDAGFVQVGIRLDYYRGRGSKVFDALTFKRRLDVE